MPEISETSMLHPQDSKGHSLKLFLGEETLKIMNPKPYTLNATP